MSTATLTPAQPKALGPARSLAFRPNLLPAWSTDAFGLALLTATAMLLLGYHPYAEDGGIYTAAVAAKADSSLYPAGRAWVEAQTHYGLFARAAAALVHLTGGSVEAVLFTLYLVAIFALLAAALHLARTLVGRSAAAWWATACVAVGAGLPIAGTSLYGVDPYCCARSLATPFLLLAWSFQLRQRRAWVLPLLAAALALHPLMALWGALPLCFTWAWQCRRRRLAVALLAGVALTLCGVLYALTPADTPVVHALALLRGYWFLSQWHWYEWFGAAAPVLLLLVAARSALRADPSRTLAVAAACTTGLALLLALCFARTGAHTSVIARLQPLRSLHLVFLAFLVTCGASCARALHSRKRRLLAAVLLASGSASLATMQRALFPATRHLEVPGLHSGNDWEESFLWIRSSTPPHDIVALDAGYITAPGNDAHGFRAASRRFSLPDRAKDGGVASVMPQLAANWQRGVRATEHLNTWTDRERYSHLQPFGIRWVVLAQPAHTALSCPFHNRSVAVCRLP